MTRHFAAKRIFSLTLALIVFFSIFGSIGSKSAKAAAYPEVDCPAAAAVDLQSGTILYEKNIDDRIFPASTTKILTALVILDRRDLSEIVTVGDEIRKGGITSNSSLMDLEVGDIITVEELLYGMMLLSGNDAAASLAVSTAGSIEAFVDMMNEKAAEIGMANTHFVTPHGIHNEEHYTTVRDMATLTVYAMKNETFRRIVATAVHSSEKTKKNGEKVSTEIRNTNMLAQKTDKFGNVNPNYYSGTIGIKTGTTIYAKGCLVAAAQRNGREAAVFIFGDDSEGYNARWNYAEDMLDYALDNFTNYSLSELLSDCEISFPVKHASEKDSNGGVLDCEFGDIDAMYFSLPRDWDGSGSLTAEPTFNTGITAPLYKGDMVGTAKISLGDIVIYDGEIYASRDIYEEGYGAIPYGPVSVIDQIEVDQIDLNVDEDSTMIMLWWLILPAALIIYLIVRIFTIKKSLYSKHIHKRRRH